MSQGATPEGTQRYANRLKEIAAERHFREAQGLTVSSLGIGTYLGQPNDSTDASYAAALVEAGLAGFNRFRHGDQLPVSAQRAQRGHRAESAGEQGPALVMNSSSAPKAAT